MMGVEEKACTLSKEETTTLRKKHIGPSCKLFFSAGTVAR
jgi:hypothetical protein